MKRGCFARRGHPALARWGRKAWSQWPHVTVDVGDRLKNPVDAAAMSAGVKRIVAATVPTFASVAALAPLLARSDLIATLPAIVMVEAAPRFDVVAMPVPLRTDAMPHALLWSTRLSGATEIPWLADLVRGAIRKVFAAFDVTLR